jgi:hypothetical protein
MTITFCNVATSPNNAGYGSGGDRFYSLYPLYAREAEPSAGNLAVAADGRLELQVLFDRSISDRHVNQSSILKPHDELVVFDRIDGDATVAPPQHAIIFGAKSSGGIPVRVNDPFEWRSMIDVTVIGGGAFEYYNDHVSINSSVVPVHNRPVVIHHFGMSRQRPFRNPLSGVLLIPERLPDPIFFSQCIEQRLCFRDFR